MLAKVVALSLVVLAVSLFTQPFSTIKVGELRGNPSHTRSPSGDVRSLAIEHTGAADFPSNAPVAVGPIIGSQRHVRLIKAVHPGSDSVVSTGEAHGMLRDPHQNLQNPSTGSLAVLRL
jgi:hypothetical protein